MQANHFWTNRTGTFVLVDDREILNTQYTVHQCYPALLAEEILRRLPDAIPGEKTRVPLLISFRAWSSKGFNIRYAHGLQLGDEQACVVSGDSLANAAAAMWIYLKENNLLPKI